MLIKIRLCVCALLLTLISPCVFAKASLYLTEDVLFIFDKQQTASVDIINRGTRTGVFEVRWLDHQMQANGTLKRLETGQPSHSLVSKVRYSPRRVTLQPGQSQRIKVALKRKASASSAGEYYSHLNVLTLNDDLESTIEQQQSPEKASSGLHVKARIGISIPVIWRHNIATSKANLSLIKSEFGISQLQVEKSGAGSLRGYVHVIDKQSGQSLQSVLPVVLYPNIDSRILTLDLTEYLQQGVMVVYSTNAKTSEAKSNALAQVTL